MFNQRRLVGIDFTEKGATVSYQKDANFILRFFGFNSAPITETEEYVTQNGKWWHRRRRGVIIPVHDEATLEMLTPPLPAELLEAYKVMDEALLDGRTLVEFQLELDIYSLFVKHGDRDAKTPFKHEGIPVRATHTRAGFNVTPRYEDPILIQAKK